MVGIGLHETWLKPTELDYAAFTVHQVLLKQYGLAIVKPGEVIEKSPPVTTVERSFVDSINKAQEASFVELDQSH